MTTTFGRNSRRILHTVVMMMAAFTPLLGGELPGNVLSAQVDPLFADWDKPDSPGFALGIVHDGKLVYERGYGMANLEDGVPLSMHSVMHSWSLAKTFTTLCVAILLDQGKIALDDPVTKFVPELPAYDPPITIRHLIHCTSGLHEYYITMQLAGWSWRDAWSGHDVLDLLCRRKSLAIKPGKKFQYSNSDFFLLGLIVERVSGRSFRRFAEENLFGPLGMKSTFFDDDPTAVVKQRAVGYERLPDGQFHRSMIQSNTVGAIGLWTTVADLVQWDRSFRDNPLKQGPYLAAFLKQGHLDNRNVLQAYPRETYKGLPRNWYTGGGPGFFAHVLRFPEQRFSVILLSNLADSEEWQVMTRNIQKIADLFLANQWRPGSEEDYKWDPAAKVVALSDAELQNRSGVFQGPGGVFHQLIVKDNQLWWINPFQHRYPLLPLSPSRFRSLKSPVHLDMEFVTPMPKASAIVKIIHEDGGTAEWRRVKPVAPTVEQLAAYAGEFFCDDLQAKYVFSVEDSQLSLQINNGSKRPLKPVSEDVFIPANRLQAEWIFTFARGKSGKISGFTIDCARVRDIRFEKSP